MENIKDFHEKKKKNWATWEDKVKDLAPYLEKIVAKLDGDKPDRFSMEKETDLLKAIVDELKHAKDHELGEKMKVLWEAYFSKLKEIYKMPGGLKELLYLLNSYPDLDPYASHMIREEWIKQYDHYMRELVSKDSTSEQHNIRKRELFEHNCDQIKKAKVEVDQLRDQLYKLKELLGLAQDALLALKFPDHKHVSSSSRLESSSPKDKEEQKNNSVSSSQEESSPSPPRKDNKRARK